MLTSFAGDDGRRRCWLFLCFYGIFQDLCDVSRLPDGNGAGRRLLLLLQPFSVTLGENGMSYVADMWVVCMQLFSRLYFVSLPSHESRFLLSSIGNVVVQKDGKSMDRKKIEWRGAQQTQCRDDKKKSAITHESLQQTLLDGMVEGKCMRPSPCYLDWQHRGMGRCGNGGVQES